MVPRAAGACASCRRARAVPGRRGAHGRVAASAGTSAGPRALSPRALADKLELRAREPLHRGPRPALLGRAVQDGRQTDGRAAAGLAGVPARRTASQRARPADGAASSAGERNAYLTRAARRRASPGHQEAEMAVFGLVVNRALLPPLPNAKCARSRPRSPLRTGRGRPTAPAVPQAPTPARCPCTRARSHPTAPGGVATGRAAGARRAQPARRRGGRRQGHAAGVADRARHPRRAARRLPRHAGQRAVDRRRGLLGAGGRAAPVRGRRRPVAGAAS